MPETQDPLLQEQIDEGKGVSSQGYEKSFSSISDKHLKILGAYLEVVRRVKSVGGKNVPIDEILSNAKHIFSSSTLKSLDSLWMQHCASSLRALIEDLSIPQDFMNAFSSLPSRQQPDGTVNPAYLRLGQFEEFLQAIVHFRDGKALQKAKDILGVNTLQEVNETIFETICTHFIQELYGIFEEHCIRSKRSSQ
jgi:hypothetical protein